MEKEPQMVRLTSGDTADKRANGRHQRQIQPAIQRRLLSGSGPAQLLHQELQEHGLGRQGDLGQPRQRCEDSTAQVPRHDVVATDHHGAAGIVDRARHRIRLGRKRGAVGEGCASARDDQLDGRFGRVRDGVGLVGPHDRHLPRPQRRRLTVIEDHPRLPAECGRQGELGALIDAQAPRWLQDAAMQDRTAGVHSLQCIRFCTVAA
jgi:hypothetical protein